MLRNSTVWRLLSPVRRSPAVVLTYHRIVDRPDDRRGIFVDTFRQQVDWLATHCDVISPSRALAELRRRRPRPAVLITFDDGYVDFHDRAYPVLRRAGVEAVNFVPTWFIDTGHPFWWDLLEAAVAATVRTSVNEPWSGITRSMDAEGRSILVRAAKRELKKHARPHLAPMFEALMRELAVPPGVPVVARQTMTWDQVRSTMDIVTIGGHAHTHAALDRLDEADVRMEVATSCETLRRETGATPRLFAYPNGAFSPAAERMVEEAGYEAAFTTRAAYVTEDCAATAIPRVHAPASVAELAAVLSGWTH